MGRWSFGGYIPPSVSWSAPPRRVSVEKRGSVGFSGSLYVCLVCRAFSRSPFAFTIQHPPPVKYFCCQGCLKQYNRAMVGDFS